MKRIIFSILIMIPFLFSECRADQPAGAAVVSGQENWRLNTNANSKSFSIMKLKKTEFSQEACYNRFHADWCAPCRQLSP